MALFQKRPDTVSPPLYSLGLNRTIIICGLGNPGKEYESTRHNIGFECVNTLAEKQEFDPWIEKKDMKCLFASKTLGNSRVILIKPTTFMNLSGEAVQAVSSFYKVAPMQIVAVYDELDIPFGQIRTRMGGSSAGHNGVKSIIQHLGDDFGRVRIGIGPKAPAQIDGADFVLQPFSAEQKADLPALKKEALSILTEYIFGTNLQPETRNFLILS